MGMVTMYRVWLVGVVIRRYIDILIIIINFPYSKNKIRNRNGDF